MRKPLIILLVLVVLVTGCTSTQESAPTTTFPLTMAPPGMEPLKETYTDPFTGRAGAIIRGSPEPGQYGYGYGLDTDGDGIEDLRVDHHSSPKGYAEDFPSLNIKNLTYIELDVTGDNEPDNVEIWINGEKKGKMRYDPHKDVDFYLSFWNTPEDIQWGRKNGYILN